MGRLAQELPSGWVVILTDAMPREKCLLRYAWKQGKHPHCVALSFVMLSPDFVGIDSAKRLEAMVRLRSPQGFFAPKTQGSV